MDLVRYSKFIPVSSYIYIYMKSTLLSKVYPGLSAASMAHTGGDNLCFLQDTLAELQQNLFQSQSEQLKYRYQGHEVADRRDTFVPGYTL